MKIIKDWLLDLCTHHKLTPNRPLRPPLVINTTAAISSKPMPRLEEELTLPANSHLLKRHPLSLRPSKAREAMVCLKAILKLTNNLIALPLFQSTQPPISSSPRPSRLYVWWWCLVGEKMVGTVKTKCRSSLISAKKVIVYLPELTNY